MSTTQPTLRETSPDARFERRAAFEKVDDDEQIAHGAVLVPDRLDHQGDFVRADTIADLREEFTARVEAGDALPGVMHAVFPDHVELVEDRQLEEAEAIGEKVLPAGTWVQAWKYTDESLWQLVKDGVLSGNSIGGTAKGRVYDPGTLPEDVEIPEPVQQQLDDYGLSREEIMAREITEGRILEVSAVDYPAVPDATHEEHKSLDKAAAALTDNVVQARLYLEARGHDEDEARRLAEYLQEHKAGGKDSLIARAKKRLGLGNGRGHRTSESTEKEGRTLSAANVARAKASIDANLAMLEDAGVATGARQRFSDDPSDDFDMGEFERAQTSDERAESRAGAGDSTSDMTDKQLSETLESLDKRLESIESKLDADDGSEDGASGEQKDGEADGDEPSELEQAVVRLAENQAQMSETIEQMADAQGASQQADPGSSGEGSQSNKTADVLLGGIGK